MASNPPLQTEDSDEDFFDKLVDDVDIDHFKITSGKAPELANVNDSNEARTFANLSISDDGNALNDSGKVGIGEEDDDDKVASSISEGLKDDSTNNLADPGQSLVSSNLFAFDNVNDSISGGLKDELTDNPVDPGQSLLASNLFAFDNVSEEPNNGIGKEERSDYTASGYHGSGIKEVQWSAFTAPVENGGDDFGSYSDFFTEFGENLVDQTGKVDNFASNEQNLTGNSFHMENSSDYSHQFQENRSYTTSGEQNTDGQDPNSSKYWENLYPGWKYDANNGQWYQVDGGYDATAYNSNSASNWTVSNMKSEAAYSHQTAQSFVGSVADKGTIESVSSWSPVSQTSHTNESFSNWNQASQGNNGYPSHMCFDPQYPGWYYDMNAQEWRSFDAYNSQITSQAQDQVDQKGFSATNIYYGNDPKVYGGQSQLDKQSGSEASGSVSHGQDYNWNGSFGNVKQQGSTMWQPDNVDKSSSMSYLKGNQQVQNHYSTNFPVDNNVNQQQSYDYVGTGSSFNKSSQGRNEFPAVSGSQSFVPSGNFSQSFSQSTMEQSEMMNASKGYDNQSQISYSQQSVQSGIQKSYASTAGRSSAGRPPHALVTFGFGGKLIVMKDTAALMDASYKGQDSSAGSISFLNLAETVTGGADAASSGTGVRGYFHTLCRQSFPGPLAGGNVSGRELNKWIDERITHPTDMDYREAEILTLLLSLLKIASQHYGKLRSPFGTDTTSKEKMHPPSS